MIDVDGEAGRLDPMHTFFDADVLANHDILRSCLSILVSKLRDTRTNAASTIGMLVDDHFDKIRVLILGWTRGLTILPFRTIVSNSMLGEHQNLLPMRMTDCTRHPFCRASHLLWLISHQNNSSRICTKPKSL